jgi:LacI family transcriptional regulator
LPQLIRDGTQLVLVGRHPYLRDVNWVDTDNQGGAVLAVQHLVELGYQRIATISGPHYMAAAVDRRDGYKRALAQAGIPIRNELIVEGDFTQPGGYSAMQSLLGLADRPSAVFVASDPMAAGALHAIHEHGLRVPEDIAVVGFGDLPLATVLTPPLTSVHQPIYELGAAAADVLLDRLEGTADRSPAHVELQTHLVIRQSSRPG